MKVRLLAACAALVLLGSGCLWSQGGFDARRTARNDLETSVIADNVGGLEVAWTATVGGSPREAAVSEGAVFVSQGTNLVALDLESGTQRWSATAYSSAAPAVDEGRVYAPSADGNCLLRILHAETGESADSRSLNESPLYGNCGFGDPLLVGSKVVVPYYLSTSVPRGPCGLVYDYAERGPGLVAVDRDYQDEWSINLVKTGCEGPGYPPQLPPAPPVDGGPAIESASLAGDQVLAPRGTVLSAYALSNCGGPTPCVETWSVDVGGTIAGPATVLANGDLAMLATGSDRSIVVVDGTTHTVEWTAQLPGTSVAGLAATPTTIFAASSDGTVAAFPADGCGAATCAPAWTATLASPASVRPSIGGDVVYIGSQDGTVSALPANGCGATACEPLWTATVGGPVTGAPVIANGHVLVGSSDGTVTAFALPA